jgi:hypothetical protein
MSPFWGLEIWGVSYIFLENLFNRDKTVIGFPHLVSNVQARKGEYVELFHYATMLHNGHRDNFAFFLLLYSILQLKCIVTLCLGRWIRDLEEKICRLYTKVANPVVLAKYFPSEDWSSTFNRNIKTHYVAWCDNTEDHHGIPVTYLIHASRFHINKGILWHRSQDKNK